MKTTIAKCKVRGETRWRVRWHEAGRVHRMFFAGRDAADTKAASVNGQAVNTGRRFLALPQADQEQLLLLHDEAMKRGVSLSDLLTLLSSEPGKPSAVPSIEKVMQEMELAKTKAGRAAASVPENELAVLLSNALPVVAIPSPPAADRQRGAAGPSLSALRF